MEELNSEMWDLATRLTVDTPDDTRKMYDHLVLIRERMSASDVIELMEKFRVTSTDLHRDIGELADMPKDLAKLANFGPLYGGALPERPAPSKPKPRPSNVPRKTLRSVERKRGIGVTRAASSKRKSKR